MTIQKVDRPLGLAILAVLEIIVSIVAILGGVILIISGALLADIIAQYAQYIFPPEFFTGIMAILGAGALIIGVIGIIIGWGLWNGKDWARIITIIFAILGIILGLFPLINLDVTGLISVAIDIIIIYYLTRPNVVAFFKQPV